MGMKIILKVLKITSFQYVDNISKKKLGMESSPVMFVVTCSLQMLEKYYEKCTLKVFELSSNSAENHKVLTA